MYSKSRVTIALASLLTCQSILADPPQVPAPKERQRLSTTAETPKRMLSPAVPEGWVKGESRSLPSADHGFTIPYNHKSGLTVTFYQYTRGLDHIPEDLATPAVQDEMRYAKDAIKQIVQLGHWQETKHIETGVVRLGDSQQNALCAKYKLKVDGVVRDSEIYLWTRANKLYKVRSTGLSEAKEANESNLKPLLTALGSQ